MPKIITKITIPIVLAGIFAISVLVAISYDQINTSVYFIIFFLIVFVFSFGFAAGQNLAFPLKKILDNATELSRGNLSSRVYLETKDELEELANTLNKIAEELQISQEEQMNAEKSVSIKVKARTQDLEETINALEQKVKNRTTELERLIEESNKLQSDVKNKGEEVVQLKKELDDFNQKIGSPKRVRKEPQQKDINDI